MKFGAPTITREMGLDVGRHVFGAVNKTEIGLSAALIGRLFVGWPDGRVHWAVVGVLVILTAQTAWLGSVLLGQAKTIINDGIVLDADEAHVG